MRLSSLLSSATNVATFSNPFYPRFAISNSFLLGTVREGNDLQMWTGEIFKRQKWKDVSPISFLHNILNFNMFLFVSEPTIVDLLYSCAYCSQVILQVWHVNTQWYIQWKGIYLIVDYCVVNRSHSSSVCISLFEADYVGLLSWLRLAKWRIALM